MTEHQSGMLNKTDKDGEKVYVNNMTLDEPIVEEVVSTDEVAEDPVIVEATEGVEEATPEEVTPEEVPEIEPDLDTEDWMGKLNEGEIFNSSKGPAPRLHGLRRLAKPFIQAEESKVNQLLIVPRQHVQELTSKNGDDDVMSVHEELALHNFPMASVTFNITLKDGRTFSDSADAFYSNCEELGLFPTAVASARAEARCLRKVLGIAAHAAEEIVDKDAGEELAPDDDSPIKAEQAKLIDKILTSLELSLKELLEGITTREVFSVEKLTTGEARKALRILNDLKKKAKKKGKKL